MLHPGGVGGVLSEGRDPRDVYKCVLFLPHWVNLGSLERRSFPCLYALQHRE